MLVHFLGKVVTSILRTGCVLLLFVAASADTVFAETVTVCDDSSLREAVRNGGTINFGCDGTIVLTSTLQITTDTVLDGTGHNVSLSGGGAVRVMYVATNLNLVVKHLTIADGRLQGTNGVIGETVYGAGIFNDGGHVQLLDCNVSNNVAMGGNNSRTVVSLVSAGDAVGGGIYNRYGSLSISNCIIAQNSCTGGAAGAGGTPPFHPIDGGGLGGGIFSKGSTLIIKNSELHGNNANGGTTTGDDRTGGTAAGGALFVEDGSVAIDGTVFANNSSTGGLVAGFSTSGSASGGGAYFTNCTATVSLTRFSTNNCTAGNSGRYGSAGLATGGALFNASDLTVIDSSFLGNSSLAGSVWGNGGESSGGAIGNVATLSINRSTLVENSALGGKGGGIVFTAYPGGNGKGGGIYNSGNLDATNTTVVSNHARGGLGGVSPSNSLGKGGNGEGGGLFDEHGAILVHCTVALNAANPGYSSDPSGGVSTANPGLGLGGGIFATNSSPTLQNSIVANSSSGDNCSGVLTDAGNNISSDASCQFTAPGSLNSTDPLLGPLDNNGGPTATMAILAGSPAIDRGLTGYCPATDQRGITRPSGAGCDIGAYELNVRVYPINALTIENYTNQILHLVFSGTNGQSYQVQTSTTLTNWTSISTNTVSGNGTFDFFYTNNWAEGSRFFRVSH